MTAENVFLKDLLGVDQGHEYHQDYSNESFSWMTLLSYLIPELCIISVLLYTTFFALDFVLIPPHEFFWNCLVYATPVRVLDFLDKHDGSGAETNLVLASRHQTHAAKSQAMRRILGLEAFTGVLGTVAQASRRRLSSLPGTNMPPQRDDSRPAGLGNWDNSCYQNSVLQGLASLDTFSEYLKYPSCPTSTSEAAVRADMKMASSLRDLIAQLKDPSNNGKRVWTPATLKSMSSWQQQDAQEYFSKVLDEIDKEVAKASGARTARPGWKEDQFRDVPMERTLGDLSDQSQGTSRISNPLEGLLAQRVGCTRCGYSEGLSMIPFNCLTVPLGNSGSYELSQCLDEYTTLEPIEGVECGKCTLLKAQRLLNIILERTKDTSDEAQIRHSTLERLKNVNEALDDDDYDDKTLSQKCKVLPQNRMSTTKSRQAVIARPPKSLAIHVNRSLFDEMTGELKKNYAEVKFPKQLDLGPWCLGSSGTTDDTQLEEWLLDPAESMVSGSRKSARVRGPTYELRAVVTHYGRHENGHYICYKKHPVMQNLDEDVAIDQWWSLSDDDVTRVSEGLVCEQGSVFMLFYDCIEPASSFAPMAEVDIEPATCSTDEVSLAANIPLPADESDDFSVSYDDDDDDDDDSSIPMNREQSIATRVSEVGNDGDQDYSPAKPIYIAPFMQSSGGHHQDERRDRNISSGSMVMV
ncbi:MAG: hypothetical protein M1818_003458 [Claussenomyces sp. TS43310]|nr:MAG: hypothetical protein M1818_003458 [Claussenomyces sp. TS43310]